MLGVTMALVFLAQAASGAVPAHEDSLARIRAKGEMTWGGDLQGGEPFVFEDPEEPKRLVGFEVEIAEALARRLGVRQRFVQVDWPNLIPALERGDFDVALNGIEDTALRRERVSVSRPYFVIGETLAVRAGSSSRTLDALKGQRVGTLNQSLAFDHLRSAGFEPVLYDGVVEPYQDLVSGRIQAVLLDHVIAARYGCPKPGVECVAGDVARGTYVVAMRKNDGALEAGVNAALSAMTASGELRGILGRWKLWDARQASLGTLTSAGESAELPERRFTAGHVRLFLEGALVTLLLSIAAFLLALPAGLAIAIARLDHRRVIRGAASVYVEVLRGTPLLLQLYVLYFALAPVVRLDPIPAAILGLALNYSAYEAEIHRGTLLAIPRGQSEAAAALGLTRWQSLRHVLLPQSLRIALPPVTNDFVALLKDSSLVSVITVVELTKRMTIVAVDVGSWLVPGIACAALYFALSYPLSRLALHLERKLAHDRHPESP